jgi:hypothetical protein
MTQQCRHSETYTQAHTLDTSKKALMRKHIHAHLNRRDLHRRGSLGGRK